MQELMRTRWAAVGAAVAITLGAGGVSLTQAALDESPRPVYVSLETPCRVADTRPATQIGPKGTPIESGEANAYAVQITGEAGDCADETGGAVPDDAVGVALNVTVIAPTAPSGRSYFTVYPADSPLPGTSSLNFVDGQAPFPNKVDVGLSPDGKIKIYNFDGMAHVAVDVFGYYIDHVHDDRYYTEGEVDDALQAAITASEAKTMFATVDGAGDLVYGSGVVSVSVSGTSFTLVRFDRTIQGECAAVAQVGTTDGNETTTGHIDISIEAPDTVGLDIEDNVGTNVQLPFHLIVTCP